MQPSQVHTLDKLKPSSTEGDESVCIKTVIQLTLHKVHVSVFGNSVMMHVFLYFIGNVWRHRGRLIDFKAMLM